MRNHNPRYLAFLMISIFVFLGTTATAQEEEEDRYMVERVKVVDRTKPIFNIYVDEDDKKWIANSESIFFVESKEVATPIPVPSGEQSLLQLPGGNIDIRWNKGELNKILGEAKITTAAYNTRDKMLWIGTDGWGIYKLKVDGGLRLIEEIFMDNSKLRSDFINLIYITPSGKVWIATEDGAMSIEAGTATIHQKFFNVQTISGNRNETWATGDGIVWTIDKRDNWSPIEIDKSEIEGEMHDIAFDQEGKIWIASNIMTSYKISTGEYEHFGPGQYFTSQFVNYVSVDNDGTIWVGSDDKGVYVIQKSSTITLTSNLDKALSCDGTTNDAKVTLRAVGGNPPYTFAWPDGGSAISREDLGIGAYVVTVTDDAGATKSETVEIVDPTVTIALSEEQPVSQEGGSDGIAALLTDGGNPGYSAVWSNGARGVRLQNLSAGNYSVTVTDQAGCTASGEIEITTRIGELSASIKTTNTVNCKGGTTNIEVSIAGGKQPYTYEWGDLDDVAGEVNGLTPGIYDVTVTDALGTSVETTIEIKEAAEFSAGIAVIQPATTDNSDGQAEITLIGGSEPFTYAWSNGETTATALTLGPIAHTVTVTDANGCSAVGTVSITENILPIAVTVVQQDDILCAGENTAAIMAQVEGGKAPFLYAWSNGQTTESLEGIGAGIWSVTVTDRSGGAAAIETEVTEPSPLVVNSTIDAVASTDNADGAATLSVQGGFGEYSYLWDNGETTASVSSLTGGDFTVTVTDANGCSTVKSLTMSENILPLQVTIEQQDDILCAGEAGAGLIADVTGGKGPYTYVWSNGSSAINNVEVSAGIHIVTVTDDMGTVAVFQTEVTEPDAIVVNMIIESPASTDNQDGIARARVSGGLEDYTYNWDNGEVKELAENLFPGEHSVTVTDANGCSVVATTTISENILPLSVILDPSDVIACFGDNDASVAADVVGGKGPFSYVWSNGSITIGGNTPEVTGLSAGLISITVTDAAESSATFQLEVQQPEIIVATLLVETAASTDNADGHARVDVRGGTGVYTYQWDNGETVGTATTLDGGSHTVTVTDELGCAATASVEVSENILPLNAIVSLTSGILCQGDASAVLTVEATGGKGPLTYVWSNGSTSTSIERVDIGDYIVTITDALGTTIREGLTVSEPEKLNAFAKVVSPASTDASDGSADAVASGGIAPYTYEWSNGEETAQIFALGPGAHGVTVTDANGCSATSSLEILEDILPLTVDVERDVSLVLCAGDATAIVKAIPNGGKGPFVYTWSDGGSSVADRNDFGVGEYTLTVTDAAGNEATAYIPVQEPDVLIANASILTSANTDQSDGAGQVLASGGTKPYSYTWDSGETALDAVQLGAGTHSITVTDNNGCSVIAEVEMTEDILPLNIELNQTVEIVCAGQNSASLSAIVSGGKGPFEYNWSDGASSITDRIDLGVGNYSVTVTDAAGSDAIATISVLEHEALIIDATVLSSANTDQSDGKAQALASGGATPYSYTWDDGETKADAIQLGAGLHSVTVTDQSGCTATIEIEVTEDILPLTVQINQTADITCAGLSTADAKATISGGKGPFTYAWSNGSSSENVSSIGAGNIGVTITDAVGQTTEGAFSIPEPESMKGEITDVRSAGAEHVPDGRGNAVVSGGAGGYSYAWDSGENGQKAMKLSIGSHTVTVTDANGCSITMSIDITKKILPLLTAEALQSGKPVRMEKLQFAADSTKVNVESIPTLTELYDFLYDNPSIVVEVGGHTNGLPEHDYCDALSSSRAKSVAQWIVQQGIDEKRVYFKGYGKRKPVASNRTPEGRKKNQRVEVRILRLAED